MVFEEMYPTLSSHANRIANGNQDLMQDLLSMAYTNFCRTFEKGRILTPGELINYMGLRAGEIKNGSRPHFGNRSTKTTNDVFHPRRYLDGDVKILHFEEEEQEDGFKYRIKGLTKNSVEEIAIFRADFERFLLILSEREKEILLKRIDGYNFKEICDEIGYSDWTLKRKLLQIGKEIGVYFELHPDTLDRYGIA